MYIYIYIWGHCREFLLRVSILWVENWTSIGSGLKTWGYRRELAESNLSVSPHSAHIWWYCVAKPGRIFKASFRLGGRIPNQKINDHRDLSIIHENRLVDQRMFHKIIQNQAYSTPRNIFGRHQSYTKNDSNIWDPRIVGQKSQGPKLSLSAHQVQVIQTLQVNSSVSGAAHPGIGDIKKRELF